MGDLFQGYVSIDYSPSTQLRSREFNHIFILFIDRQDVSSMQMATDRMNGYDLSTNAQL